MKKYIVSVLLLVFFATMFFGCHPTGVGGTTVAATDTGQATEESPPTESPHSTTATSETAITTSEDPTNYEPSETGNTTVSESAHESTEPNTEETTEAGTTEPKPTEPTPTNPPHTHSWSAWTQTKAPTCTTEGAEKRSCSCGATETRIVSAPGHNMGAWSQDKAPTCGADGLESRSCTRCGWAEKVKIPATGNHSWNETAPTCTEAGSKTCTVCGQTESIAALGHDWVHHDEEGHWRDVVICRCGAVFYDYDTWVKHSDENWENGCTGYSGTIEWVVDKPAYDSCSRCGATR